MDGDTIEKEVEIKDKFTADMMPPRPMIRPVRPNMPRGRAPRGITSIRPQGGPQHSSVRPRAS